MLTAPRSDRLTRVELAALAAVTAIAVAAWLAFGVLPTFDSLYALVWGSEILSGTAPGFADFGAPTQHPLWVAVGTVLAPFGDTGARAMTLLAVLSFVALVGATYDLGRSVFGPLAGAIAAALLLTRLNFGFYAAFAFVDMPFAALVMAAAALEARKPRRGGIVWVLLVPAGLLRPEGWVFAAAYGLWMWRGMDRRARLRIAAWVMLAPLLWALSDLVATGDPLFSWTYTAGEAQRLGRAREWHEAPQALWAALAELLKRPVVVVGALGVALVVARRRSREAAMPLALLVVGAATFWIVVLGGVSGQVPRYAAIAGVALLLFAGHLVAELVAPRSGAVPGVVRVAVVVLVLAGAAWSASRLHPKSVTSLLSFREAVEHDLDAALYRQAVRRARRCGPVAVSTFKLVPVVRRQLDVPAHDVVARNDPDAGRLGRPGVVLLERTRRLLRDPGYGAFGQQGGARSPPSAQAAPTGYVHRGRTRYFEIYTRC